MPRAAAVRGSHASMSDNGLVQRPFAPRRGPHDRATPQFDACLCDQ